MADRSILFSAPMVRALLDGRKTQTRRVMNPQPVPCLSWADPPDGSYPSKNGWSRLRYAVGDRLWVREAWNIAFLSDLAPGETIERTASECAQANNGFACACGDGIVYRATAAESHPVHGKALWRPSIHMPRWASRITLTVTEVRVQRLQDITEEDAIAEGVVDTGRRDGAPYSHCIIPGMPEITMEHEPSSVFAALWEHINGDGSWKANPWVAAYTFTVEHRNIDAEVLR